MDENVNEALFEKEGIEKLLEEKKYREIKELFSEEQPQDIAAAIDGMNMSVVVGTLAGDDTVMIVMRDNNAAAAFCGEIKNLIN